MNVVDVKRLIHSGETDEVEFKRGRGGVPASFWESYSAFANTDGGVIVLGVKDENGVREIEGLDNVDKIVAGVWNAANNHEKVSANVLANRQVYPVEVGGKRLVVVDVPRAARTDRPVYVGADVFKGTFRRNGEGDYHCSREAVEAMLRDRCPETADNCLLDEMRIADLDDDSVRRYRMIFQTKRPEHAWNKLSDEDFLCKIGAAKADKSGMVHPLLSGLLCFGDFVTIMGVLPDYFLDYREKVDGGARWKDRVAAHDANWSGNIVDFYFRIYDRLTSDVKVPFALDEKGLRINETKVHKALRELLANALIHADYHGRRGIVIEKHYDTITFRNPGCMRLARELAIAGGNSDARNARIFNIFALIDVGERSGMGLSNFYSVWDECGYDRPIIEELHEPDQTVLTVKLDASDLRKTSRKKTSTKSTKTVGKNTSTKNRKTVGKKTRGKSIAEPLEPLEIKGETTNTREKKTVGKSVKTVGKKTVGKNTKTVGKKTSTKSEKSRRLDTGLKDEDLVVLRLTSSRVVWALRKNPNLTREELAALLNVSLRGIEWQVAKLQKDKAIRRVGGRKFGHWEVLI